MAFHREDRGGSRRPYGALSPYQDVNEVIEFYVDAIVRTLGENLLGVYLTGSLSYAAFRYGTSDIDIIVIVHQRLTQGEIEAVRRIHQEIAEKFNRWSKRLESSYTPIRMLSEVYPPKEPRPYWGGDGVFYEAALYGNEWIINNYLLYRHGIALHGPEIRELMRPVDIVDVQKASIRDLFQEWEPKSKDEHWFRNSHYATYFILNLCRILYTVMNKEAGSKSRAAAWVKARYGEPWKSLILTAENWHYGLEVDLYTRAIDFLNFVIGEVSQTEPYNQLSDNNNDSPAPKLPEG